MNKPKQKGTAAETAVVAYLREHGFPTAERRALAGSGDKGDVSGVVGCVIEIKSCARTELAAWIEEARKEAAAAHAPVWAVWHKRRGKGSPAEWFVTMTGEHVRSADRGGLVRPVKTHPLALRLLPLLLILSDGDGSTRAALLEEPESDL